MGIDNTNVMLFCQNAWINYNVFAETLWKEQYNLTNVSIYNNNYHKPFITRLVIRSGFICLSVNIWFGRIQSLAILPNEWYRVFWRKFVLIGHSRRDASLGHCLMWTQYKLNVTTQHKISHNNSVFYLK